MTDMSKIKEHMEVIGADGTHVGTVDRVENRVASVALLLQSSQTQCDRDA
jgi:hypothetical protein